MIFRSDFAAKAAFVSELVNRGYNAQVVKSPADIKAVKDDQVWYFEIKMTTHSDRYFGAATMTEWQQALRDSDHFRFVVAIDRGEGKWEFREYTPAEFMEFSTIPPFKVYFNIDFMGNSCKAPRSKSKAVRLTSDSFKKLSESYEAIKPSPELGGNA